MSIKIPKSIHRRKIGKFFVSPRVKKTIGIKICSQFSEGYSSPNLNLKNLVYIFFNEFQL